MYITCAPILELNFSILKIDYDDGKFQCDEGHTPVGAFITVLSQPSRVLEFPVVIIHLIIIHYAINYNELFSSEIGTNVMHC